MPILTLWLMSTRLWYKQAMSDNEILTAAESEAMHERKTELRRQRGIAARRGRPKGSRHGLNAVMAKVKLRGLAAIDKRTVAARALLEWRDQLISDLGGAEYISAARMALIDTVARTKVLLDAIDFWLLGQPEIIRRKRKTLIPVVTQRLALADNLARTLNMLGLDRIEKQVTLEAYLAKNKEAEPEPVPECRDS